MTGQQEQEWRAQAEQQVKEPFTGYPTTSRVLGPPRLARSHQQKPASSPGPTIAESLGSPNGSCPSGGAEGDAAPCCRSVRATGYTGPAGCRDHAGHRDGAHQEQTVPSNATACNEPFGTSTSDEATDGKTWRNCGVWTNVSFGGTWISAGSETNPNVGIDSGSSYWRADNYPTS